MIEPAAAEPGAASTRQRLVPCCGHAFDENLLCRCRVSWWSHQQIPQPCPMEARRHNCRAQHPGVEPGPA
jgi:hypothetical protein